MGAVIDDARSSSSSFTVLSSQDFAGNKDRRVTSRWAFSVNEKFTVPSCGRWVCVIGRIDVIVQDVPCFRVRDFVLGHSSAIG